MKIKRFIQVKKGEFMLEERITKTLILLVAIGICQVAFACNTVYIGCVIYDECYNLDLKQVYSVYYLEAGRRFFRRSRSLSAGVGLVILFRNFALS